MGDQAQVLFKEATEAYLNLDGVRAAALHDMDAYLDDLQRQFIQVIFESHAAGNIDLQVAVQLAVVARFYERIGDHAVNVGDRTRYIVNGWLPDRPYPESDNDPPTVASAVRDRRRLIHGRCRGGRARRRGYRRRCTRSIVSMRSRRETDADDPTSVAVRRTPTCPHCWSAPSITWRSASSWRPRRIASCTGTSRPRPSAAPSIGVLVDDHLASIITEAQAGSPGGPNRRVAGTTEDLAGDQC